MDIGADRVPSRSYFVRRAIGESDVRGRRGMKLVLGGFRAEVG